MAVSAKSYSLGELARLLGATLSPAEAAHTLITSVAAPQSATSENLVFAEDARSLAAAVGSSAAAIITTKALAVGAQGHTLLLTAAPRLLLAGAAALLRVPAMPTGIDPHASIASSAKLNSHVSVGPFAVVGEHAELEEGVEIGAGAVVGAGCILGPGCRIYPRAVLYPGVRLGSRVVVHAGAVLGSDGFGYVRDPATGAYVQFPQQGTLVIEDDVEIGANTTVDRGALGETRIGRGTKLDNLVHVGHNVTIGQDTVIAAQTGVSGSRRVGRGAVIAGQVGIADHVEIGEGVILGAQCGVPSNKRLHGPGILFWGTPARPITQYLKELAALARLARKPRASGESKG